MAGLTGFHILIIVGVVVLLFGAAKLPIFAKNLGQSARILKKEMAALHEEPTAPSAAAPTTAAPESESQPVIIPKR